MKILLGFARARPLASLVLLSGLLLAGITEGLGLSSFLPLVSVAFKGGISADATGLEARILSIFAAVGLEPTVGVLLGVITAAFVLKAILVLLVRRQVGYVVARVVTQMRFRLLRALLRADWPFYVKRPIGTLTNSLVNEAFRVGTAYTDATWVAYRALTLLLYVGIALAVSWRVTIVAMVVATVLTGILGPLVRSSRRAGARQTRLFRSLVSRFTDFLQGVKPLKAMGRQESMVSVLEKDTVKLQRAAQKHIFMKEALAAIQEPLLVGVLAGGLFFGRKMGIEPTGVALIALLLQRTYGAMNKAQQRYQKVVYNESAYWAMLRAIDEAEAHADRLAHGPTVELREGIELEDVHLHHGESEVLCGLSLSAPAGEVTALVGPSGAGKTTIVDLLAGLVHSDAGHVKIDGVSLETIDLAGWRRSIGYVPQDTFLLHDTIAMNVTLGDPTFSEADVERALREAHAWDFVSSLAGGVDAVVGERGLALSGGQRQRIAIARALIHQPRLLILDEATTALDPASEAAVLEAIEELRGRATVIAVSHQPALTRTASRVYRIEAGKASLVLGDDAGAELAAHASR